MLCAGAIFNNYTGDIWRGQIVHNLYVDANTTVTTRFYAQDHRRDRYQIVTLEDDPSDADDPGIEPVFVPGDDDLFDVVLAEGSMFGRLRTFRHLGGETRAEFANLPFLGAMSQTIQTGIRYEYQDMTNRNFLGESGEVLENGDADGLTIFERNLRANTVSAFVQTDIKAARDVHIVPGVRFEWYDVKRTSLVTAEEEGEAEEHEDAEEGDTLCDDAIGEDECLVIEGINRDAFNDGTSSFHALPGISFAYTGFYRTTLFGGYHRGLSTAVLRNEDFPTPDEIGDNFQIGMRSTAFTGLEFEVAGFHQRLHDFQFGSTFSAAGDRSFGRADEVHINGVELNGRLNSRPFTGGPFNLFGEANYTYNRAIIEKGVAEDEDGNLVDFSGNDLPEVPFHIAALTLGIEKHTGWRWDASVTWTYRGSFFTDEFNTPYGGDAEGEVGEVPSIWLLSARFNLDIGNTGASMFVAGTNLLDELYITDREDGLKPGMGRTIWTGFKYKF
jgi:Fe(3+) dicitrate transport protein